LQLSYVAASVPGGWAAMNGARDDRWGAEPELGWFAVADAAGPRYGGYHTPVGIEPALDAFAATLATGAGVLAAVRAADRAARAQAPTNPYVLVHIGLSLTALVLDAVSACVAQIGSGRAYLLRGGELRLLAPDHCLPPPHDSVVSALLGFGPEPELELPHVAIEPGDRFVLCTDGAWRAGDHVIRRLVELDDVGLASEVAELAARTRDDATAVVVRVA